jgi:hypothetical protein
MPVELDRVSVSGKPTFVEYVSRPDQSSETAWRESGHTTNIQPPVSELTGPTPR